jgi:hypothetical protein
METPSKVKMKNGESFSNTISATAAANCWTSGMIIDFPASKEKKKLS